MNPFYPWQQSDWARLLELRRRLPNALLLKGGQGIGKFDLALNFAQSLLCKQPQASGHACGRCDSCHWFEQGSHPDFKLLQAEAASAEAESGDAESDKKKASKVIKIEQLRALEDFFNLSSHQGHHRVVVISPAETLHTAAANALLKTLEEPTAGLVFILVSHKPQQLLPTILSRCLAVSLTMPPSEIAQLWLEQQGVADAASVLAQAGFAPLVARDLAGQEKSAAYEALLTALSQPATLDALALAEQLQRAELPQLVHWIQQWSYDLAAMKMGGRVRFHAGRAVLIGKLADKIDPLNLMNFQRDMLTARRESQHTLNPRLFLESIFLSYKQLLPAAR
ncbi:MAG: DNA polymerase III subunit delta' [Nitrosomonadales bacterium]|nr:DNA polymerase III subunit delta' [Nitrosomonadales bacterium]